jgi:hypothetical protein
LAVARGPQCVARGPQCHASAAERSERKPSRCGEAPGGLWVDRHEPLAGLIVRKRGCGVKRALKGSSGVFRKGHTLILCKRADRQWSAQDRPKSSTSMASASKSFRAWVCSSSIPLTTRRPLPQGGPSDLSAGQGVDLAFGLAPHGGGGGQVNELRHVRAGARAASGRMLRPT